MAHRYPAGIASFQRIRERGHCYVDKTALIYELGEGSGETFFLSRPRRFGKTLLCSTLEALFSGNRELFGAIGGQPALAIDSMDWEWRRHPVVSIRLNAQEFSAGLGALEKALRTEMRREAKKFGVVFEDDNVIEQFKSLIEGACEKTGEMAVVIVDEYDKPLLDTIDQARVHKQVKSRLRGYYSVLKAYSSYLRFVFVTGITKFSKVSIFSELNHLTDLSFDPRYAAICGITQEELEDNFASDISSIASNLGKTREEYLDALRDFYNGYRFSASETRVYNPYGLLLHFESGGQFQSYWYETGSPSFLVRLVSQGRISIPVLTGLRVHEKRFHRYNVDNMDPEAVLYQGGYLTITGYDADSKEFQLEFPNEEIRSEYVDALIDEHPLVTSDNKDALVNKLPAAFESGDIDGAIDAMYAFVESIPYGQRGSNESFF